MKRAELDSQLREWAQRSEPSEAHMKDLRQRIAGKLAYVQRENASDEPRVMSPAIHVLARSAYAVLGAAVFAMILMISQPWNNNGVESVPASSAVELAAWESDILLRGQDLVEAAPNPSEPNRLSLWVLPLEDGKIAINTSLFSGDSRRLAAQASVVAAPGETIELSSGRQADLEYRVLQTVVLLGGQVTG